MGNVKQLENSGKSTRYAFSDVEIDARAHSVTRTGHEISLEPKAFAVLLEFVSHPGELLDRDTLLDAVWGHSHITPGTLNRIIAQLRRALGDDSKTPRYIQTVHGLGYRFIAPLEDLPGNNPIPPRFTPPPRARLPQRIGSLIARESDIDQLKSLLGKHRLVTVAGAGGIGKTQLALETARQVASDFPDGVWMLDCTPHADRDDLLPWMAILFDLGLHTTDTEEVAARLGEMLSDRHALLVFDNCERIVGALGETVTILLGACADLHVLTTSQRRLNCAEESLYVLPPLAVPPAGDWTSPSDVDRLSRVPSVQLLLMRLETFDSGFALTPGNASAVAAICQRLDGLPLALEIAAAQLRLLSPAQLLARMQDHLLKLAETKPDRPAHHQTLHALIEWSFGLLSAREQALLCGLSVFASAVSLDAANAVGKVFGLDDEQVLELMSGLLDKSLLAVDASADPRRYRLLDSVRLFARERLAENALEPKIREAHLAYFMQLTAQVNANFRLQRQKFWTECIKREWANLKAAFAYALSRQDLAENGVAMTGNLCWYFRVCDDYGGATSWLERALAASALPTTQRAQALIALGLVLHHSQVHERSGPLLRQGITLATQLGETGLTAAGEAILAFELATCGDFDGAQECVASALATASELDDAWLRAMALLAQGITHALNDHHRDAEHCLDEAFLTLPSQDRLQFEDTYTLLNRGLQRFYLGHLQGAAQDWLRCMDLGIELQNWRGAAGSVEGAAYLAEGQGDAHHAAQWLAAAAQERHLSAGPLMPQWRKAHDATCDKVRQELGQAFEVLQRQGARNRFEQVAEEARDLLVRVAAAQGSRRGNNKPSGS